MIEVLSFLSNENCFAGHSRGPYGPHVARRPRFEHHWPSPIASWSPMLHSVQYNTVTCGGVCFKRNSTLSDADHIALQGRRTQPCISTKSHRVLKTT